MIQVEGDPVFTRIGIVEVCAAIVIPADAMAGSGALDAPAVGRCMVWGERLEIAQEINRAPLTPFDSNNLGAEARQQTRRLRPDLKPGQIDDSDTLESAWFYNLFFRHRSTF